MVSGTSIRARGSPHLVASKWKGSRVPQYLNELPKNSREGEGITSILFSTGVRRAVPYHLTYKKVAIL